MPFVHIRLLEGPLSEPQKTELIARTTQVLSEVLGKKPSSTWVVIEEVPATNWGVGGAPLAAAQPKR